MSDNRYYVKLRTRNRETGVLPYILYSHVFVVQPVQPLSKFLAGPFVARDARDLELFSTSSSNKDRAIHPSARARASEAASQC